MVKHALARGITVRAFVADWIAKRRGRGFDWKNDESRLKHHVLPELGDLPLAKVPARHVVDLFHKLRTDRERNVAQRTIYNIYTVVSALFRDAKLADLIEQSCCRSTRVTNRPGALHESFITRSTSGAPPVRSAPMGLWP